MSQNRHSLASSQSSGFGLVGVMVAVAIMGLLATIFSSQMQMMFSSQNSAKYINARMNLHEEIRATLSSKEACLATLSGLTLTTGATYSLANIKNNLSVIKYAKNVVYDSATKITDMNLIVGTMTGREGEATLRIHYTASTSVMGPSERDQDITLSVESDGTNVISTCIAKAKMSDGIWRRESGATDDIYFGDGNVGVGVASPIAPLQVAGNVMIGSSVSRATPGDRGQLQMSSTYVKTANTSTSIDWDDGNIQELRTFLCNGTKTITFSNLKDGAAYSLLISGTAGHTGICKFAATGFTFQTAGGATAPTASKDVLFTFAVINTTVIYSMMDDLQDDP